MGAQVCPLYDSNVFHIEEKSCCSDSAFPETFQIYPVQCVMYSYATAINPSYKNVINCHLTNNCS